MSVVKFQILPYHNEVVIGNAIIYAQSAPVLLAGLVFVINGWFLKRGPAKVKLTFFSFIFLPIIIQDKISFVL